MTEAGGTNIGGEDREARKHIVVLNSNTCTCGRPSSFHLPCSHMVTACRVRRLDVEAPSRVGVEFSLQSLINTWAPRSHPFCDEDEWPVYEGPKYIADKGLKVTSRGT